MLKPTAFKILGIVIAGAGYACKECTDAIERKRSGIGKQLDAYNESSRHQQIRLTLHAHQTQLTTFQNKVLPKIDYKGQVLQDTITLRQIQGWVQVESEELSRLIDKMMFRSRIRERYKAFQLQQAAPIKYEPSKDSSRETDWTDAAQVKIAICSTAVVALPGLVFADGVITTAKKQVKFLGSVVHVGRRAMWILYLIAACLAGYGAWKGIK
jgi:hypothetical protein